MGKGRRKKWKRELHCPVSPQLPARTERLHHLSWSLEQAKYNIGRRCDIPTYRSQKYGGLSRCFYM